MPVFEVEFSINKSTSAFIQAKDKQTLRESLSRMTTWDIEEFCDNGYDKDGETMVLCEVETEPQYGILDGEIVYIEDIPPVEETETEDEKYVREYAVGDPRQKTLDV